MPFLWDFFMKRLTNFKRPSPKCERNRKLIGSIERASLPVFLKAKLTAGMTVEAAAILPLFLCFFVNLGCAMEMIRLHGNIQLALWNVGNKLCVYGCVKDDLIQKEEELSEDENEWWESLADIALTGTYVKDQVIEYAGETYLDSSPISGGAQGLQLWESEIFQNDKTVVSNDIADIVITYQVSPWIHIPFVKPFRMLNRYYGRLWTGYDVTADGSDGTGGQDVVYITENASVYHESLDCTHLSLSIREVSPEEAKKSHNEEGRVYRECDKCRKKIFGGTVFIGREGDCYHYDRGCPGLRRIIYTIPRSQASAYNPCSRCAVTP